jgi:hypothetical protein
MMAKQVEKLAEVAVTASADAREAPALKTTALTWQSHGFCWRDAFVQLPEGMLFQDLQDVPAIWRLLQRVPQTALKRFDRVTCVAFDQSWCAKDVLVVDADETGVVLALKGSDRITLPSKPTVA